MIMEPDPKLMYNQQEDMKRVKAHYEQQKYRVELETDIT
jgi:hypothetical protein